MSHKNLALGSLIFIISFIALITFFTTWLSLFQTINPVAASIAVIVAVVGIFWFKKSISQT